MSDFEAPRDDLVRMVELGAGRIELRAADDDDTGTLGTLVGYAAVFDVETVIDSWEGRFREKLAKGAFAKTLRERGDKVKVLFNHGMDPSVGKKPLGKPETQREDGDGLWVEVPLDDTSYNRDIAASLRSGALDGMSFMFSVKREEWDEGDDDELPLRTIREVSLFEYGPVTFPAYEATSAGVRAHGIDAYQAWLASHQSSGRDAAPTGTSQTGTNDDTPPALGHLSDEQRAAVAAARERAAYATAPVRKE